MYSTSLHVAHLHIERKNSRTFVASIRCFPFLSNILLEYYPLLLVGKSVEKNMHFFYFILFFILYQINVPCDQNLPESKWAQ